MAEIPFFYHAIPKGGGAVYALSCSTNVEFQAFILNHTIIPTKLAAYFYMQNKTQSLSLGIYSLNANTLSLMTSVSLVATRSATAYSLVLQSTSYNAFTLNPGLYYFGFLGNANLYLLNRNYVGITYSTRQNDPVLMNIAMSESTNALPASYETSKLPVGISENGNAHPRPAILLVA